MPLSNYIILLVIASSRNLSTNQTRDTLIQVLSYIAIIMAQENNVSLYTKEVFHNRVRKQKKILVFRETTHKQGKFDYIYALLSIYDEINQKNRQLFQKIKLDDETKLKTENQLFQQRLQLKSTQNKKVMIHEFSN